MTPADLALELLRVSILAETRLRISGAPVEVDGRMWYERTGEVLKLSVPTVVASELTARAVVAELDLRVGGRLPPLAGRFDAEAADYRVHVEALRRAVAEGEVASRRFVSTVGPPRCPTAIQVLRRRASGRRDEGPPLKVVGFMRSERLVPLLPLDLLLFLWAAGAACGCGREVGPPEGRTDLTLLIGSLHVELADPGSFIR